MAYLLKNTSCLKKIISSHQFCRRKRQSTNRNGQVEGGPPENTYYNFTDKAHVAKTERKQSTPQGEMTDDSNSDDGDSDLQNNKVKSDGRIPAGLDSPEYEVVEMEGCKPSTKIQKDKLKDHIKAGNFIKEYQVRRDYLYYSPEIRLL